jgi:hypothetical protein
MPAAFLLVATQQYKTGSPEEYVILGNDALLKCNIPSFVADFVDSEASIYYLFSSGSVASTFLSWSLTLLFYSFLTCLQSGMGKLTNNKPVFLHSPVALHL